MTSTRQTELFQRHPGNPILTVADLPYQANTVFNAGAARVGDETVLLLRVEDRSGLSHLTVARSADGVTRWVVDSSPTFIPSPETHPEELWGVEDPRLIFLEERQEWAVLYTAYSPLGPQVSLATTKDFKTFQRHGVVMPPEDKDAALFPIRFDGRWAMLHRPAPNAIGIGAHIWLSFSPDLKHWGDHQIVIRARDGAWWDARKIGLSPPPIPTDRGWLVIYHGVKASIDGGIYRLGLALLDRDDPTRVLSRGDEWVFSPTEPYEVAGDVNKVVFPCGWTLEDDQLRIYYGGADSCMALATASISNLLNWLP